jgi:hypothetical protein
MHLASIYGVAKYKYVAEKGKGKRIKKHFP